MEILKIMLRQRGIDVAVSEKLEYEGAETTKIGRVLVFMLGSRITEKDVTNALQFTEEQGGTLGILVVLQPPSATVLAAIRERCDKIQIFHTAELQFDITTHRKVPPHRILSAEERAAFLQKKHIRDPATQMPLIDSQDKMARWIGAKPGDIVEILRKSETAGSTPYYRCCVADVTL
jgi:DNA-directed RNA polymerase subunit H